MKVFPDKLTISSNVNFRYVGEADTEIINY